MTAPRVLGPNDGKAIADRYGLQLDFESIQRLLDEHGLNFGPPQ